MQWLHVLKKSLTPYQSTRRNILEDTNLQLSHLLYLKKYCHELQFKDCVCSTYASGMLKKPHVIRTDFITSQTQISDPVWSIQHFINGFLKFVKDV
jgi:hypothetical protein